MNDNPLNGLEYTYSPQTFYISTNDYIQYPCQHGTLHDFPIRLQLEENPANKQNAETRKQISTTTEELYKNRNNGSKVFIDIPGAKGKRYSLSPDRNCRMW